MSIALRGDEGYYSREIVEREVTFRVRELDDAELKQVLSLSKKLAAAIGKPIQPEDAVDPETLAEVTAGLAEDKVLEVVSLAREFLHLVVGYGVVSWDMDRECSAENAMRLPPPIKLKLAKAIMDDTQLAEDEQAFLPG